MLKGLFKPAWQSDSVDKRLDAVAKMDAGKESAQSTLLEIANRDVEQKVRDAAINKLGSPLHTFELSQTHADQTTRQAAEAAFCRLVGANSELNEQAFRDLLEQAVFKQQKQARLLLVEHCPIMEIRHELLNELSEAEQAVLIGQVDYAQTRKLIAEQISEADNLEVARKALTGKDKTAEKIIRQKLEHIRATEKETQANKQACEELCEKMEFIANHAQWRSEFKPRFSQYKNAWESLSFKPTQNYIERFTQASMKAAVQVEKQTHVESAMVDQLKALANLEDLCKRVAKLDLQALLEQNQTIRSELADNSQTWLTSSEVITATTPVSNGFLQAQRCLTSVADFCEVANKDRIEAETDSGAVEQVEIQNASAYQKALNAIEWSSSYPSLLAVSEAQALIADAKKHIKQQSEQTKNNLDKLHKRINRLLGTTNRGDLRRAKNELSATLKAAESYSGHDRKKLDERLEQATEVVNKMVDWQNFATEPKLIELCESMESLVKADMHPDKRAQKISALQKQWKELAYADVADQHWDRFKAAADLAYEPCAVFFAERREQQAQNLAKREPLVAQMQSLLDNTDWDNEPDYKRVENGLRDTQNAWQKIKDVERSAGQKQWKRLSKIRADIYTKLDVEYDANIERKNKIINQLENLLDGEINEDTLAKLQLAQTRWKQVGVTRRKEDQAAWQRFKTTSDAVYEKLQDKRKAKRAEEDEQLDEYRKIIKAIYALAKSATNLAESDPQFDQLKNGYAQLPAMPKDLPEKLIERIAADFSKAKEAYAKAHERLVQSAKNAVLETLANKAQLCTQLEAAVSAKPNESHNDMLTELNAIEIGDKALEQRFAKRIDQVMNSNRKEASEARRLLCIDAEILLDIPSPEEDRALRTQIQLDRMKQQGLVHSKEQTAKKIKELMLDWYCLPGAKPDVQQELQKRFDQLRLETRVRH